MASKEKLEQPWMNYLADGLFSTKSAARIKVYANNRTFRGLVIDSVPTCLNAPLINGTSFESCSFSKVKVTDSTIRSAKFEDCQITKATIRDIICVSSDFANTSFKHTTVDAIFIDCCFYDVDFTYCDFSRDCRFINCIFDACSFPGADVEAPVETFSSSQLHGFRDIPFIPMTCPETGEFVGYKKAIGIRGGVHTAAIVKLLIPEGAARSSATGRKCRCQFARVLSIEGIGLSRGYKFDEARSFFDNDFVYRTGETVCPNKWDENRWDECSNGIHFFMSRQEAIDY